MISAIAQGVLGGNLDWGLIGLGAIIGVVVVINAMIGLITPPYGVLLFVTNAVTGIPLRTMIAEIWGFIAVLVAALFAMILFPEIVLWLPRLFGYEGR